MTASCLEPPFHPILLSPAADAYDFQIVDKTIMEADQDKDGKISFEEFKKMVENTDVSMSMTLGMWNIPQTGRNEESCRTSHCLGSCGYNSTFSA